MLTKNMEFAWSGRSSIFQYPIIEGLSFNNWKIAKYTKLLVANNKNLLCDVNSKKSGYTFRWQNVLNFEYYYVCYSFRTGIVSSSTPQQNRDKSTIPKAHV